MNKKWDIKRIIKDYNQCGSYIKLVAMDPDYYNVTPSRLAAIVQAQGYGVIVKKMLVKKEG